MCGYLRVGGTVAFALRQAGVLLVTAQHQQMEHTGESFTFLLRCKRDTAHLFDRVALYSLEESDKCLDRHRYRKRMSKKKRKEQWGGSQ